MSRLIIIAALLVLISNGFILTEVFGNRNAAEKQTLTLTEREFILNSGVKEDSAIYLDLDWQVSKPLRKGRQSAYPFEKWNRYNLYLPLERKDILFGNETECSIGSYRKRRNQERNVDLIFEMSEARRENYVEEYRKWLSLKITQAKRPEDKVEWKRQHDDAESEVSSLFLVAVLHPGEKSPQELTGENYIRLHAMATSYNCNPEIKIEMINYNNLFVEKTYRKVIKNNPDSYLADFNIGSKGMPWVSNIRAAD